MFLPRYWPLADIPITLTNVRYARIEPDHRHTGVPAGQGRARGHRGHGGQARHARFADSGLNMPQVATYAARLMSGQVSPPQCPLWVIRGHFLMWLFPERSPLYPRKRSATTFLATVEVLELPSWYLCPNRFCTATPQERTSRSASQPMVKASFRKMVCYNQFSTGRPHPLSSLQAESYLSPYLVK